MAFFAILLCVLLVVLRFFSLLKVPLRRTPQYDIGDSRFVIKDFHYLRARLVNAVDHDFASLHVALQ
uniref:Putative secreted peptide n=1 Tax=Anopheles braziliensis TaxID=58242 RepID=A0A2M3ZSJ3_9DIPT